MWSLPPQRLFCLSHPLPAPPTSRQFRGLQPGRVRGPHSSSEQGSLLMGGGPRLHKIEWNWGHGCNEGGFALWKTMFEIPPIERLLESKRGIPRTCVFHTGIQLSLFVSNSSVILGAKRPARTCLPHLPCGLLEHLFLLAPRGLFCPTQGRLVGTHLAPGRLASGSQPNP